jgi:formylglycine-generating enzyme required for sulfatase activity
VNQKIAGLQERVKKADSGGIPANRYAKKKPAVNWIQVAAGGALLMFCCLLSIAGVSLFNGLTRSAGEIPSFTAEPSEVVIAESPTASPTLALVNEIVDDFEVKMALVSAGEFMMGSELGDLDEQPVHIVELDAFYMDVYEVTNRSYLDCVSAGVCSPPGKQDNLLTYNSALADYPVTMVDWDMAKTFCEWRGARLPTEAEWEKAARGTDERIYPWGDDISCDFANYDGCQASLSPVGSYPRGVSPYGMYDMAGNVYEWVADHYYDEYYRISPLKNPLGPEFTDVKSIRGGAIRFDTKILRSSMRFAYHPSDRQDYLGFRCASGVTP